jgi:hypothetical protein
MPLLLNAPALIAAVTDDTLPRVALADDGSQHVLFLDGSTVRSMLASDWPPPLPTDPTPSERAAGRAARLAAENARAADAAALRQKVMTVALSAVGQSIDTLTAQQVRALIAVLLYKAGALDAAGVVQPLAAWL